MSKQFGNLYPCGNAERSNASVGVGVVSGRLKPEAHFAWRQHIACISEQTRAAARVVFGSGRIGAEAKLCGLFPRCR
jgi:hypothetical protein